MAKQEFLNGSLIVFSFHLQVTLEKLNTCRRYNDIQAPVRENFRLAKQEFLNGNLIVFRFICKSLLRNLILVVDIMMYEFM
ncbi:MAG: hypothetical protein N2B06_10870 [Clostridium sp.]